MGGEKDLMLQITGNAADGSSLLASLFLSPSPCFLLRYVLRRDICLQLAGCICHLAFCFLNYVFICIL